MLTVPQAAKKAGKNPETIRRWIREGRLKARKVGTQHVIEEADLTALFEDETLPLPRQWSRMFNGKPMPNWELLVREQRASH